MERCRHRAAVALLVSACAWTGLGIAPASSGQQPSSQNPPTVDGTTITGTYTAYEGRPFFEAGYRLPKKLLSNVASITCSSGGVGSLDRGPGRSPECSFHPPQKMATMKITGKRPWFEVDVSFRLTEYWSYNDQTYKFGHTFTLRKSDSTPSATQTKAQAAESYLTATAPVNSAVNAFNLRAAAWNEATATTRAASDAQPLATALQDVGPKLIMISHEYRPVAPALKIQAKAVKVIILDIKMLSKPDKRLTVGTWNKKFKTHLVKLARASTIVRSELGLPPPSALRK